MQKKIIRQWLSITPLCKQIAGQEKLKHNKAIVQLTKILNQPPNKAAGLTRVAGGAAPRVGATASANGGPARKLLGRNDHGMPSGGGGAGGKGTTKKTQLLFRLCFQYVL